MKKTGCSRGESDHRFAGQRSVVTAVLFLTVFFGSVAPVSAYAPRVLKASGTGRAPSSAASTFASPSSDGRFVAFQSLGLSPAGFDPLVARIYLRDTLLGTVSLVSEGIGGVQADGFSGPPAISGNGRFVAWATSASNVVPDDANSAFDVVRRDLLTGETRCVSLSMAGVPASGDSHSPALSEDGRFVVFVSGAPDLVAGDDNGKDDIFIADLQSGTLERISSASAAAADGDSSAPAIDAAGDTVAFVSDARNLVENDTNASPDVFVWHRSSGAIERASVNSAEVQANGSSHAAAISANGDRVAFESLAGNLVSSDRNGVRDVFVRDLSDGTTVRGSYGVYGAANGESREPSLSKDGRKVAFTSSATNLVRGDTNARADIFVRDLVSRSTVRVNLAPRGIQTNSASGGAVITSAGSAVVFNSSATNLAAFDLNRAMDVFTSSFGRRSYRRLSGPTSSDTAVACSTHAFSKADVVVVANPGIWHEVMSAASLAGTVRGPLLFAGRSAVSTATLDEIRRLGASEVIVVGSVSSVDDTTSAVIGAVQGVSSVRRIWGGDRYRLASAIASEVVSLKGGAFDGTVFVVSGSNYSESLAGLPLSAARGRPYVLVNRSTGRYVLPPGTRRAVILGGTGSVSSAVQSKLRSQLGTSRVTRIAGTDRYATAVRIAEWGARYQRLEWDGVTIVSSSRPADAACGGVMAGRIGTLTVVTAPTSLPTATRVRLTRSAPVANNVRFIGSTSSISTTTYYSARKAMGY